MDELAALVALDLVAVTGLLTLGLQGDETAIASVVGIVVVVIAGTIALVMVAEATAKHEAELHRADRATDAALLSRSSIVVDDHASPRWFADAARARLAMQHRSVGIGHSIEVSQPSIVVGNGMTETVDHGLMLRLAAPGGD